MKFSRAEPDEHLFVRWKSENKVWELGFFRVSYGIRVRAGKIPPGLDYAPAISIDYCAGADEGLALHILAIVTKLLSALPESVTAPQVESLFPTYEVKPIDQDPCWDRLLELSQLDSPWPELIQD